MEPNSHLGMLVAATTVEPSADLLQGAEVSGGRTADQPEGEPHPVQQTSQAGQLHQPCKFLML